MTSIQLTAYRHMVTWRTSRRKPEPARGIRVAAVRALFASQERLRPGSPLGGFAATGHFFFVCGDRFTFDAAVFEAVPASCLSDEDVAFACLSRSSNELGGYPEVSIPLKIS